MRKALPLDEIEFASPQILSQLFSLSDVRERAVSAALLSYLAAFPAS
jgi:hypothetical protein